MCGIAGLINAGDYSALERMTSLQAHRGPDDSGLWESRLPDGGWVGLGSRRLAILDLSPAGHMPMATADGRYIIVYNGEVYNYPELRKELEDKGYTFHSHSDTEAILYLYQEFGVESVRRLNGMFAIAIWDQKQSELFLARDHFGIKPLYYWHDQKRFAFASEVKSIVALPEVPRRLNLQALHQYLTFLWVPDPLTMFDGIHKLRAGHYAIYRDGKLDITQYWDLTFPPADYKFERSEAELIDSTRNRFVQCVKSQLLSDVPVGSFLSAGLDSSCIVAAMAQVSSDPVRTYTIAFPKKYRIGDLTLDDTEVARRTADHFGCEHTEIVVEPDVADLLPKLAWHMDEPTADPAIIMAYLVNREARKTVTVLLSGVGGDEIFAGYRKYVAHGLAQRYQRIPQLLRRAILEPLALSLPSLRGTALSGRIRLMKKMARSGSLSPRERFIMDSTYLTEAQKEQLYLPAIQAQIDGADPRIRHLEYFENVADADFLNQMMYLDCKAFMVTLNLTYNDKMSMASSVEARVPFIDWQFAEWVAWNVPPSLKLKNGVTKSILRDAMRSMLPDEVLRQKKASFGGPTGFWVANDLRPMIDDLLSETNIRRRGLFEPAQVRRMITEQRTGRQEWAMQIWQLLTLEIWMRTFLDNP